MHRAGTHCQCVPALWITLYRGYQPPPPPPPPPPPEDPPPPDPDEEPGGLDDEETAAPSELPTAFEKLPRSLRCQ